MASVHGARDFVRNFKRFERKQPPDDDGTKRLRTADGVARQLSAAVEHDVISSQEDAINSQDVNSREDASLVEIEDKDDNKSTCIVVLSSDDDKDDDDFYPDDEEDDDDDDEVNHQRSRGAKSRSIRRSRRLRRRAGDDASSEEEAAECSDASDEDSTSNGGDAARWGLNNGAEILAKDPDSWPDEQCNFLVRWQPDEDPSEHTWLPYSRVRSTRAHRAWVNLLADIHPKTQAAPRSPNSDRLPTFRIEGSLDDIGSGAEEEAEPSGSEADLDT